MAHGSLAYLGPGRFESDSKVTTKIWAYGHDGIIIKSSISHFDYFGISGTTPNSLPVRLPVRMMIWRFRDGNGPVVNAK